MNSNELLLGLKDKINGIESTLNDLDKLNDNYKEIHLNIIEPIKKEGLKGIRATMIWAIVGIILTTIVSIIISIYYNS